jgi:hypothetical protein
MGDRLFCESAVDLSQVKLRYYFTKDSASDLSFWCDYAQIGSANVEAHFVTVDPAKGTADTYLEIGIQISRGEIFGFLHVGGVYVLQVGSGFRN